jgi:hypothetical protein
MTYQVTNTYAAHAAIIKRVARIMVVPVWEVWIEGKTAHACREGWSHDGEEITRIEELILDFDLLSTGEIQWSLKTFYIDPTSPHFGQIDYAAGLD